MCQRRMLPSSFEEDISQPTSVACKWDEEQIPARHQSPIPSIAGLDRACKHTGRLPDPTQNNAKTQMTAHLQPPRKQTLSSFKFEQNNLA